MPASAFGIMLATHCKRTDTVDVKGPLLAYIKSTYSDREAEEATDDLNTVQALRAEVALASANATTPGMRETLTRQVFLGLLARGGEAASRRVRALLVGAQDRVSRL